MQFYIYATKLVSIKLIVFKIDHFHRYTNKIFLISPHPENKIQLDVSMKQPEEEKDR